MAAKRKKMGRPPFKPTRKMRTSVERMCAVGDSQDTIARALGIDRNTLAKHFHEELLTGAAKRRREVVDMIFDGASNGNASLIKRAEEMSRAATADTGNREPEQPAPKVPKLGKREAQQQEAIGAGKGSDWGDDLAPLPGAGRLN